MDMNIENQMQIGMIASLITIGFLSRASLIIIGFPSSIDIISTRFSTIRRLMGLVGQWDR